MQKVKFVISGLTLFIGLVTSMSDGVYFPIANFIGVGMMAIAIATLKNNNF